MIEVSDEQKTNAESPIDVTLLGISTEESDVQLKNALLPIVVTLLGITTLVMLETYVPELEPCFKT